MAVMRLQCLGLIQHHAINFSKETLSGLVGETDFICGFMT